MSLASRLSRSIAAASRGYSFVRPIAAQSGNLIRRNQTQRFRQYSSAHDEESFEEFTAR